MQFAMLIANYSEPNDRCTGRKLLRVRHDSWFDQNTNLPGGWHCPWHYPCVIMSLGQFKFAQWGHGQIWLEDVKRKWWVVNPHPSYWLEISAGNMISGHIFPETSSTKISHDFSENSSNLGKKFSESKKIMNPIFFQKLRIRAQIRPGMHQGVPRRELQNGI